MKRSVVMALLFSAATLLAADPAALPGMRGAAIPAPVKNKDICHDSFDHLKDQLSHDPEDARAWEEFRLCTSELKRWTESADVSRSAVAQGSRQPGPHVVLGLVFLHTKEYQKAADEFDFAIGLKHDQPMAYYYLGMSYLFLHQPELAAKAAETAVELDSSSASNYSQLAYAELLLDHQDRCEQAARKAIQIDPNSVAAYKVLGNLYAQQGKKEESDKAFEEAIHANGRLIATSPFIPDKSTAISPVPRMPAQVSAESGTPMGEPEDLCRDQWNKMKTAMVRGDTAEALTYFSDYLDTRQQYRQAFTRMGPDRAREIFENMGDLEDCKTVLFSVMCKTTVTSSRNGEIRSLEETVRCERNDDKVWRLRSF